MGKEDRGSPVLIFPSNPSASTATAPPQRQRGRCCEDAGENSLLKESFRLQPDHRKNCVYPERALDLGNTGGNRANPSPTRPPDLCAIPVISLTAVPQQQESHIPCVKPLLNNRQRQKRLAWAKDKNDWTAAEWSKVMFSDESKFSISFGNQGPRVWRKRGEAQNPRCLRSSVKFPQSVMVWGAMSSAGVGPLCFLRSKVNTAVYQEVLEHFMIPAADQLYGDADFIFQQDLAPAHSAKATSTWFKDHGIPVLNLPANSPDLNPIENLWGIVKRKMRYARPNNAEELKATIRATWALITPEQCHRLIDSMPRRIAAVIQAKGAPTKY